MTNDESINWLKSNLPEFQVTLRDKQPDEAALFVTLLKDGRFHETRIERVKIGLSTTIEYLREQYSLAIRWQKREQRN